MNNIENIMILNNKNIGISRIELNKNELYIIDKTNKYSLCVHIYNWKELNKIEIGKKQKIEGFDIELNSLEVRVFIDYKDVINDSIVYSF